VVVILTDGRHLVSDGSVGELHAFARGIDLAPAWFQDKRIPHYDLLGTKPQWALRAGAAEVSARELVRRAVRR